MYLIGRQVDQRGNTYIYNPANKKHMSVAITKEEAAAYKSSGYLSPYVIGKFEKHRLVEVAEQGKKDNPRCICITRKANPKCPDHGSNSCRRPWWLPVGE